MRPMTATDNVFDFQALLHPGTVFEHQRDVLAHSSLTVWPRSGRSSPLGLPTFSAIASCPALRAPDGLKGPVSIDAILEALCELDVALATRPAASQCAASPRRGPRPLEEDPDGRYPSTPTRAETASFFLFNGAASISPRYAGRPMSVDRWSPHLRSSHSAGQERAGG
jgi:hypothetical protein